MFHLIVVIVTVVIKVVVEIVFFVVNMITYLETVEPKNVELMVQ